MDALLASLPLWIWGFAFLVALVAGFIKGVVGFAMPMLLISGLSSVMSPELALAGLILPTLATNAWQALRHGVAEAWGAVKRYKVFLWTGLVVMLLSAQLVRVLSPQGMLLLIGVPMVLYAAVGLAGWPLRLPKGHGLRTEAMIGGVAGFFGGISGNWGPATAAMLTAQDIDKRDHVRIQGVIYTLGSLALMSAHFSSGVLRLQTLPLSILLVIPSIVGMWLGLQIHDRLDQATFRRLILFVLLIAGLNLIRRAF
ncbi:sulfite exporter TauE/SafE family protein [Roseovarius sp. 2305UL8-3]|uniref:sulfite exporter TauE/SafE family protein n=1 Tax=Roseovarius conchicola TaxID=3121636 RepID=UPI0035287D1E